MLDVLRMHFDFTFPSALVDMQDAETTPFAPRNNTTLSIWHIKHTYPSTRGTQVTARLFKLSPRANAALAALFTSILGS